MTKVFVKSKISKNVADGQNQQNNSFEQKLAKQELKAKISKLQFKAKIS